MSATKTINVLTASGPRKVRARLVTEHFAVHRTPMATQDGKFYEDDDFWTVTHLRTGYAVQYWLESFDQARRLVEHIERPDLNWDFDTPRAIVVNPGCCARLDAVWAWVAQENGQMVERVKRGGHRYSRAVPYRAVLYGPTGRVN